MDESVVMCDEVIKPYDEGLEAKLCEETNFNEKKATCKTQNFDILLAFLLITIALLIVIGIYCYLIKQQAKQKHLLPFHDTNNDFKDLNRRTAPDKLLGDKAFIIAKDPKLDGCWRGLGSMVYNFFDNKTAGGAAMLSSKSVIKIKNKEFLIKNQLKNYTFSRYATDK